MYFETKIRLFVDKVLVDRNVNNGEARKKIKVPTVSHFTTRVSLQAGQDEFI